MAHHRPYWNELCGGKARSALWSSWVALRCRTITPLSTIAYDPKQTSNPISRSVRVARSSHAKVLDGSLALGATNRVSTDIEFEVLLEVTAFFLEYTKKQLLIRRVFVVPVHFL